MYGLPLPFTVVVALERIATPAKYFAWSDRDLNLPQPFDFNPHTSVTKQDITVPVKGAVMPCGWEGIRRFGVAILQT